MIRSRGCGGESDVVKMLISADLTSCLFLALEGVASASPLSPAALQGSATARKAWPATTLHLRVEVGKIASRLK